MKFLYSDSLDFVDPLFDFVKDQRSSTRRAHSDDLFPHEFLETPPYDGLLVSRAIVGDVKRVGKYNDSQAMRFRREGARAFLRFPESKYPGSMLMGDNGAFTYRNEAEPPHTVENTLEFYHDAGFTHGCSIDHLIFDFQADGLPPSDEALRRYNITLSLAEKFLPASREMVPNFTPVGVIQGWSAASMAASASALVKIGFTYLAVGGMVPLQIDQIKQALQSIRDGIPSSIQLHLLGFGKTEELASVRTFGVSSFDTTSPLLRAFKDGKRNYYSLKPDGTLDYYMAVRIPQALDNDRLMRRAKRGHLDQESLLRLERDALQIVRACAARKDTVEAAVQAVLTYGRYALWDDKASDARNEAKLATLETAYTRTLSDRPWERCDCRVCREAGVDALIFRSSNRNKRRGMHNLHVFYRHLKTSEPVALEETV